MHRSEAAQFAACIECGAELWPERDRSYLITADDVLCYACAQHRGGAYDEIHDRWTQAPNLRGLSLDV